MRTLLITALLLVGFGKSDAQITFTEQSTIEATFSFAKIHGYHLFASHAGGNVIGVYNIADRSNPIEIISFNIPAQCTDILVHNSTLYIGTTDQLLLYDWSNPATPTLLGSVDFDQQVISVSHENDHSFVTTSAVATGKIFSVDVSTPATPFKRDSLIYNQPLGRAHLNDGTLYQPLLVQAGIQAESVDVSNPQNLSPMTTLILPIWIDLDVADDRLIALDTAEIRVYSLADPYSPVLENTLPVGTLSSRISTIDSARFILLQSQDMEGIEHHGGQTYSTTFAGNAPTFLVQGYENEVLFATLYRLHILSYVTPLQTDIPTISTSPISLYPNPTQSQLYVDWPIEFGISGHAELYSMSGRLVHSTNVDHGKPLELSIAAGTYHLSISVGRETWSKRIVILR
jgi:hypothetical protein